MTSPTTTAVATTLEGVERHPDQRIFALFEPRSATSCRKVFSSPIPKAFDAADRVWIAANGATELPESERFLPEDLVAGLRLRGVEAELAQTSRRSFVRWPRACARGIWWSSCPTAPLAASTSA